jgi:hypothetical protein
LRYGKRLTSHEMQEMEDYVQKAAQALVSPKKG